MAYRHRTRLATILCNTNMSPWEVPIPSITDRRVSAVAIDFDGVLAAHGESAPDTRMVGWLERCVERFTEERIFILTNRPSMERTTYFERHFPGIRCINGVRKKPYPDGVLQVLDLCDAIPDELLLIDDRLMTGVLAGCIAGTRVMYISRPIVQVWRRPIDELFFMGLRILERFALGMTWIGSRILAR